ncbi:hypothetical protein Sjap_003973 [Stephania japonica]|uniref:Uncharacterized protein n=1 Tax=Stephania japonica TaxID=461633 RepID=A0AAP0PJV7_9MAGN
MTSPSDSIFKTNSFLTHNAYSRTCFNSQLASHDDQQTKDTAAPKQSSTQGITHYQWGGTTQPQKPSLIFGHSNFIAQLVNDELSTFCVGAILILNRQKIIKETNSIDDLIKCLLNFLEHRGQLTFVCVNLELNFVSLFGARDNLLINTIFGKGFLSNLAWIDDVGSLQHLDKGEISFFLKGAGRGGDRSSTGDDVSTTIRGEILNHFVISYAWV